MSIFKKVTKEQPKPISFVAAVKQHGDYWKLGIPADVHVYRDSRTFDEIDAINMLYMEKGVFPRIAYCDQIG